MPKSFFNRSTCSSRFGTVRAMWSRQLLPDRLARLRRWPCRAAINPARSRHAGWVTPDDFLAGYGAAQAVPGPLFTFSAYLGAIQGPQPNGVLGGTVALTAIFLPSFLLVIGGFPAWSFIRRNPSFVAALRGVNAAVVGLLLAALYSPVFTSGVESAEDFSVAIAAFGLLAFWKAPPWIVVVFTALAAVAVAAV